jgi:hypothetical protein
MPKSGEPFQMHHPTNAEVPKVTKLRIGNESRQDRRVPSMGDCAKARDQGTFSLEMATQSTSQRFEIGRGHLHTLDKKARLPL